MTELEPKADWTGFPQKLVLGAFGILFTMLVTYFIWLGTEMVEVRQKVTSIESRLAVIDLRKDTDQLMKSESNKQRLDALEEEGTGTE